jgi:hypothetical protein
MAFGLYFAPTAFTPDVYDETIRQLEQAGAGFGSVPGRTFHCAMEAGGMIQVFDVWSRWSSSRSSGRRCCRS